MGNTYSGINLNMYKQCGANSCANWSNFISNGLNMLGGNSMLGNFQIGNMLGGNFFTNCYGDINYDKMAGFGVANALLGVVGQAVSEAQAEKASEKNDLENAKSSLEDIESKITSKTNEKSRLETKNTDLKKANTDLSQDVGKLSSDIATKQAEIEQLKGANEGETDAQTKEREANLAKAQKELEKLETQKSDKEKEIEENNKTIKENNEKIEKLDDEISELKTEKEKLEKKINDAGIKEAQGKKYQVMKKEEYDALFNTDNKLVGKSSKSALRAAFTGFSTAANKDEKMKYAKQAQALYTELDYNDRTTQMQTGYNIICKYLKENQDDKS